MLDRLSVRKLLLTAAAEQPMPFQALFTFDRIKALAPQHPDWKVRRSIG